MPLVNHYHKTPLHYPLHDWTNFFFFFKRFNLLLTVLGLCCYVGFSLVVARGGYPPGAVLKLLLSWSLDSRACRLQYLQHMSSVAAAPGSRAQTQYCGPQAWLLHSMWDPPRSGIEPMSPALAGRFFTTEPTGKPWTCSLESMKLL